MTSKFDLEAEISRALVFLLRAFRKDLSKAERSAADSVRASLGEFLTFHSTVSF
jgi:hypothetical protein